MDEKRVLDKLDEMGKHLNSIDVTLAKQEVNLDNHIRRTDLAEESISLIRDEIKPIKKHIHMMEGALKLIGVLSLVVGLLYGVVRLVAAL